MALSCRRDNGSRGDRKPVIEPLSKTIGNIREKFTDSTFLRYNKKVIEEGVDVMKTIRCVIGICCALLASGCAAVAIGGAAAAGAGSVTYFKGELKAIEKGSVASAYTASLNALVRLGMFVTQKQKDKTTALITARRSDDTKVTIRIKRVGDEVVQIRIRVGLLGEEGTSRQILSEIQKGLQ